MLVDHECDKCIVDIEFEQHEVYTILDGILEHNYTVGQIFSPRVASSPNIILPSHAVGKSWNFGISADVYWWLWREIERWNVF